MVSLFGSGKKGRRGFHPNKKRKHSNNNNKNDSTAAPTRKTKRKEERAEKKKRRATRSLHKSRVEEETNNNLSEDNIELKEEQEDSHKGKKRKIEKKKKKKKDSSRYKNGLEPGDDIYADFDPDVAAAMQRDDAEIAELEAKLGIKGSGDKKKSKEKLNREYAKLEGYGDDFGSFLDDLDGLGARVQQEDGEYPSDLEDLDYDSDESDIAATRAKALIQMEEAQDLKQQKHNDDFYSSSEDEEVVPMKEPPIMDQSDIENNESQSDDSESNSFSDDDSDDEEVPQLMKVSNSGSTFDDDKEIASSDEGSGTSDEEDNGSSDEDDEESDAENQIKDHDPSDTYRPVSGQDLYGNVTDKNLTDEAKPKKYIPPHLRRAMVTDNYADDDNHNKQTKQKRVLEDDLERKQTLKTIQRSLNNMLNRLSDNTLESVAKTVGSLYSSHSSQDVNECFWMNIRSACVPAHVVMTGLIPVYMACVTGVHFQRGDAVQLGGHVMEKIINDLWEHRQKEIHDKIEVEILNESDDGVNKEVSNIMLLLCYLYNFNVVHCTFIYDIIRGLIKKFTEQDVELLLLVLKHCGYQLRSDDPMALKEIVKLVQERALVENKSSNSRVEYMLTAIIDLKNNKRKKNNLSLGDKISFYRKAIGRMKTSAGSTKSSDTCSRITLKDILDVESKGRWWKVGASWIGNQFHHVDDNSGDGVDQNNMQGDGNVVTTKNNLQQKEPDEEDELLILASKQRMNTDERRTVFCIIMGGDDCEDTFEKLVRAGMLRGKLDREVARVLVHCCGQERAYNPYYAHLATRICEYQPKSSFTFKLAYFDIFKQFEDMKARKAANLAKLLVHLVSVASRMNMTVLKAIEISPQDMPDNAVIFLTIFFTNILESYDDPQQVKDLFDRAIPSGNSKLHKSGAFGEDDMNDEMLEDEGETLRESLAVFLLQYIKESPLNVKKSVFSKNLKAAIKSCEADRFESMFMSI